MTIELYITCFGIAFLGQVLQALLRIKALQDKARKANVKFQTKEYFVEDWATHAASITTTIILLILVDEFAHFSEFVMQYVKFGFAFVGYTGSDIASRLFSVVNKRINNAIDYKTTIADEHTNNTQKPTPAE